MYNPNDTAYAAAAQAYQAKQDQDHINVLAVIHYIYGGLIALTSCFFLIHFFMGLYIASNPSAFASPGQTPPPAGFGAIFMVIGGAFVLGGWTIGGFTAYAGRCLARRRSYTLILVVSCLNCLAVPIGTALGVFTLVVLMRPSVKASFEGLAAPPPTYSPPYAEPPGTWPPPPGS